MGDPLQWQEFWDQFEVSNNSKEILPDTDQSNYLRRFSAGQVLVVASGLTLSSKSYKETTATERYVNPQILISARMISLLKIRKVKDANNIVNLRKFYSDVENCLRNLKTLDL